MPYNPDLDEYAERLAETDTRHPARIAGGLHATTVAGSAAGLDTDEMGFYQQALEGSYNDLWEDDYVVVEPFDAPRGQSYLMQLVGLDTRDIREALDDAELDEFLAGGAVVHGPDHAGRSYDHRQVDDRITRQAVQRQGIIPAGRNVRIREFVDPTDLDVDTEKIGRSMARDMKGEDYEFQI
jgi:hypothetical protein